MDTGPKRLGSWLDVTMSNRGLKNRDLARMLDVTESAVHNWRKGKNLPQLDSLQRMAQTLEADPVRLAVTAGLLDPALVGQEPLPMPEPVARRAKARTRANELLEELATLTADIRGETHEDVADKRTLAALNTIRELIGEPQQ